MPVYDYRIGTVAAGTAGMTNVESLDSALAAKGQCVPPRGLAIEDFSVYRTAVSGLQYGDGFPRTEWEFDVLHQDQLDDLLAFIGTGNKSASVLIRTRKDDRTYDNYEAVMHRPVPGEDMTPAFTDHWHDVRIPFTMLEVQ